MKKALSAALAALLIGLTVTSCAGKPRAEYTNFDSACQLGNVYYDCVGGNTIWDPAWNEIRHGLCYDPLCAHNDMKNLCPDNTWLNTKAIITDGERLYLSALDMTLTDENNTMYSRIWSLKPDGSNFKEVCTYESSGTTYAGIRYSDGYIYFARSFYRGEGSRDDLYQKIMRVAAGGGKIEEVSGELEVGTKFFVDDDNLYLISPDSDGTPRLTIIGKDGNVTENAAPDIEGELSRIQVYMGKTYLLSVKPNTHEAKRSDGGTAIKKLNSDVLYRFEEGRAEKLGEGDFVFTADGILFTDSDVDYIGTKTMPNGLYGENEEVDFFAVTTKKIYLINPETLSVTESAVEGLSYGDEIEVICGADGRLLADISNQKTLFDTGNSGYRKCLLGVGKNVTVIKTYGQGGIQ